VAILEFLEIPPYSSSFSDRPSYCGGIYNPNSTQFYLFDLSPEKPLISPMASRRYSPARTGVINATSSAVGLIADRFSPFAEANQSTSSELIQAMATQTNVLDTSEPTAPHPTYKRTVARGSLWQCHCTEPKTKKELPALAKTAQSAVPENPEAERTRDGGGTCQKDVAS